MQIIIIIIDSDIQRETERDRLKQKGARKQAGG